MDRDELLALHATATIARDHAHRAYTLALKNRRIEGDTQEAYRALLEINKVRDRIYAAALALSGQ